MDDERHNLLSLNKLTGMPRRTLQDAIAAFEDIGIRVEFIQEGSRNNAGYYRILTWGPISSAWVDTHLAEIAEIIASPLSIIRRCEPSLHTYVLFLRY